MPSFPPNGCPEIGGRASQTCSLSSEAADEAEALKPGKKGCPQHGLGVRALSHIPRA